MENNSILVKYSELVLKGKNRSLFSNKLESTISRKLNENSIDVKIIKLFDHILILDVNTSQMNIVIKLLKEINGISSFSPSIKIDLNKDLLREVILSKIDKLENKKFRITAKNRKSKLFDSSISMIDFAANIILENSNLTVDLTKYDINFNIEVIHSRYLLLYTEKIRCNDSLPTGTTGNGLLLLSGGIDSPVSGALIQERGMNINFITFLTEVTATNEVINKIKKLAKILQKKNSETSYLYFVDVTGLQSILKKSFNQRYKVILLRRFFLRIASKVASKYDYDCLITGDSLSQVASQTIEALECVTTSSKKLVLHPVIALSKIRIIELSKKYNLYETSILKGDDFCQLFAPKDPILKPKKDIIDRIELELFDNVIDNYVDEICSKNLKKVEIKW